MRGDPDDEDRDVDRRDDSRRAPLDPANCAPILGDESDTIDNDLHE